METVSLPYRAVRGASGKVSQGLARWPARRKRSINAARKNRKDPELRRFLPPLFRNQAQGSFLARICSCPRRGAHARVGVGRSADAWKQAFPSHPSWGRVLS